MNDYESYNPDIDLTYDDADPLVYGEETQNHSEQPPTPSSKKGRAKSSRVGKNSRAATPRKEKKTSTASSPKLPSLSEITGWIKACVLDTRMRIAVGVTSLLLGVYLLIAFLSYVSDGLHDQSQITNLAVGAANDVHNMAGEGGARLSQILINDSFGVASAVIIIWLIGVALKQFGLLRFKIVNFTIKCLVALVTASLIVGLMTIGLDSHFMWGGAHGYFINTTIIHFLGWSGAALLSLLLAVLFFLICLYDVYKYFLGIYQRRRQERIERELEEEKRQELERRVAEMQVLEEEKDSELPSQVEALNAAAEGMTFLPADHSDESANNSENQESSEPTPIDEYMEEPEDDSNLALSEPSENTDEINIEGGESVMKVTVGEIDKAIGTTPSSAAAILASEGEYDPRAELSHFEFPPTELLPEARSQISVDQNEQLENQERIRRTLADFGIGITEIKATVGPTVTLYEIKPDSGVRINRIRNLGDDIALSLAAIGVRIIAPIPGKGTVGIEVANKEPQIVAMRTLLESRKFHESRMELPLAIGSTINNQVYIADLAKMPHLLVAGATGQGKSVGLNAMIASLLYRKHPSELKLVLVDPKMVEFSLYRAIERHYLAKLADEEDSVITRPEKVVATLSSLCVEMDDRYELLKAAGVRNIKEYNAKFRKRVLNPEKGHKFMPYIVVIVDEFADLIMTAGKEVETPIARLAQKARAVGIHVILATQRPSANVITGVIKANFPARIAFKVASGIDSKTILDATGAQQLIGRGDMLISNNSEMERVQCALIDTPEVTAICEHIASQPGYPHPLILPEPTLSGEGAEGGGGFDNTFGDRDPLFEEIARLIVGSNSASTSSIQRKYRIGYNRAGSIMDQMEAVGIVGPAQGGKPRQVLVDIMTLEQILGSI